MLLKVHKVYVKATSLFFFFAIRFSNRNLNTQSDCDFCNFFRVFSVFLYLGVNKVFLWLEWLLKFCLKVLKFVLRILVSANYNLTIFDFFYENRCF